MGVAKLLFVIAFILVATACGKVNLNVGGLTPSIANLSLATSAEFVASSQQGLRTVSSYNVNASAGESLSQMAQVTPNGYTVYTTIQGEFVSDQIPGSSAAATAAAVMSSSSTH